MVGWATLPPMDGFSVLSSLLAGPEGRLRRLQLEHLHQSEDRGADPQIRAVELDEPKRRAMLVEALKIAHDDVAYIPLHQQPVAWAVRDGVDVPQFPDEYVRLWFANVK